MWPFHKWAVVRNGTEQVSQHWTKSAATSAMLDELRADAILSLSTSRAYIESRVDDLAERVSDLKALAAMKAAGVDVSEIEALLSPPPRRRPYEPDTYEVERIPARPKK